jgi:hypothetical protein
MAKVAGSLLVCFLLGYAPFSFSQLNGIDRPPSSNDRPILEVVFSDLRPPNLAPTAAMSTSVTGTGTDVLAIFTLAPIAPIIINNGGVKIQPLITERPTPRVFDRKFKMLTALSIATMMADLESTLHCGQCREINPLYGAHPTRVRLYGINAPFLVGELMVSRMLRKRLPEGKSWMIPSLSMSAAHMVGVASNLHAR